MTPPEDTKDPLPGPYGDCGLSEVALTCVFVRAFGRGVGAT